MPIQAPFFMGLRPCLQSLITLARRTLPSTHRLHVMYVDWIFPYVPFIHLALTEESPITTGKLRGIDEPATDQCYTAWARENAAAKHH